MADNLEVVPIFGTTSSFFKPHFPPHFFNKTTSRAVKKLEKPPIVF